MNWSYLAGFTDGDGCITRELAKGTYSYARIRWSQKLENAQVLSDIMEFLVSKGIKATRRNLSVAIKGHKYPQAEVGVTNAEDTRIVLHHLLPYLTVKRQRAIEALSVLDYVSKAKAKYGNKYRNHLLP